MGENVYFWGWIMALLLIKIISGSNHLFYLAHPRPAGGLALPSGAPYPAHLAAPPARHVKLDKNYHNRTHPHVPSSPSALLYGTLLADVFHFWDTALLPRA